MRSLAWRSKWECHRDVGGSDPELRRYPRAQLPVKRNESAAHRHSDRQRGLDRWQPHLDLLRRAISSGGLTRAAPARTAPPNGAPVVINDPDGQPAKPPGSTAVNAGRNTRGGLVDELERLARLREARALSDNEFTGTKAKLLD